MKFPSRHLVGTCAEICLLSEKITEQPISRTEPYFNVCTELESKIRMEVSFLLPVIAQNNDVFICGSETTTEPLSLKGVYTAFTIRMLQILPVGNE